MTPCRGRATLAFVAVLTLLAGCPEQHYRTRAHRPPVTHKRRPVVRRSLGAHHEHSHEHPHGESDHHHHPHPHPHLAGANGHHHPY